MEQLAQKTLKFLASLKLAVIVIVGLGTICAWGTIVESQFNSEIAQKLVYRSIYMYGVLGLLIVNLIAVMMDRLPWKKRHIGFLLAHVGIITVLLGSYITQKRGLDGSISFDIGESNRYVTIDKTDLTIYELVDFTQYKNVFSEEVDFFLNPPKLKNLQVPVGNSQIKVIDYMPFAIRKSSVIETTPIAGRPSDGPAVRFQLKNKFATVTDWMVQSGAQEFVQSFGPAKIILSKKELKPATGGNVIVLWPTSKDLLGYAVYNRDIKLKNLKGTVKKGEAIHTQWMDMKFEILNYFEHGKNKYEYEAKQKPTELTTSAILVEYNGFKQWSELNSSLELYSDDKAYVVSYANRRIPLGFNMKLLNFEVSHYKGTNTAMSYESHVEIPQNGDHLISMNEPLKHNGYTFYQASFQEDETGKPTTSVLTVNRDPGRFLKYLGCIILVSGTIYMFYSRRTKKIEAQ